MVKENSTRANTTLSAKLLKEHYRLMEGETVLIVIGVGWLSLAMNSVVWKLERYFRFEAFELKKDTCATLSGIAVAAAAYFGYIYLVLVHYEGDISFWWRSVPPLFCALFLVDVAEFILGKGARNILRNICTSLLISFVQVAMFFLVFQFLHVNLLFESQSLSLFSGIIYPTVEVLLKYLYRHVTRRNSKREVTKQQGFIYIVRNLEIVLGKPNLMLMFLLDSVFTFIATFCLSTILQSVALLLTNVRLLENAHKIKLNISKRVTGVAPSDASDESIIRAFEAESANGAKDDLAAPPRGDARTGHFVIDDKAMEELDRQELKYDLELQKAEFAVIRNCEEIGEKVNILLCPITIGILISYGMAQSTLTIQDLCARAGIAFIIQTFGQLVKMHLNALYSVWEHAVQNRMHFFGIINLATINICAEAGFLAAFVTVLAH